MLFSIQDLKDNSKTLNVVDEVLYKRAQALYKHFEDNKLWCVGDASKCYHTFFDGRYGVSISPSYVKFHADLTAEDFVEVDLGGVTMVRFKRHLKPKRYFPNLESRRNTVKGRATKFERDLHKRFPTLTDHCLNNKGWGWIVQMCHDNYPVKVIPSLSIHVARIHEWAKTQTGLTNFKTHCYDKRVGSLTFAIYRL